ncbi:MAG: MFS transporter [Deltaproteobacteria bacterium]|nr:MFS transporter [Deltaproteobacteria bacterium]
MSGTSSPERLFTKEFLALNGIAFLTFCNMAIFFQFYRYLQGLLIGPQWHGFLIALFSITGLIVRPFISPFLHTGNARLWMLVSTAGVTLSLWGYNLAGDFWSMFLVRAVHGITYVVLGAALNASLVGLIPPSRSGQAFGLVTVITLLPFAVVPPVLDQVTHSMGGLLPVLNAAAVLMLLVWPLSLAMKTPPDREQDLAQSRFSLQDVMGNLKNKRVAVLLVIMLLLYSSFTPVFFFLESYAKEMGVANPGLFFTLSTMSEIGIRLAAGSLFDKMNKASLIAGSLAGITLGYLALAHLSGETMLYALGIFLGLGWGIVMPVLNALMFDISPVHFRGLNTNLGVQMFQGGFFLGPLVGAFVLAHCGFRGLYYLCACLTIVSLALTPLLVIKKKGRL